MKRLLTGLLALSAVLFGACMSDNDDEVTVTNYCYISKLTLGSFRRAVTVKGSDGKDSVYYTSISGRYFPMTIDHRNLTIENRDSLPCGADVSAVLFTASFDGISLSYRTVDADSTCEWQQYRSTDSVDFTKPLQMSVMAADQQSYRIYTVKVNVHQQEGDSLYWTRMDSVPDIFEGMTETRALWMGGKLNVLGETPDGMRLATRTGGEWNVSSCTVPEGFDLTTLRQARGRLYASTAEGQVVTSEDAFTWTQMGQAQEGLQLVAVTDACFYAIIKGMLCRSTDAETWEAEELDEDASHLPTHNVLSIPYTEKNGRQRLLLAGEGNQPAGRSVWAKNWRAAMEETSAMWMYYTYHASNQYPCPVLRHQTLIAYDNRLFTFGGARTDAKGDAMGCLYVSNDNGVTWKRDLYLHLPYELVGVEGPVTAVTDEESHIWIIADNQVWRGRLNRLAFDRQ